MEAAVKKETNTPDIILLAGHLNSGDGGHRDDLFVEFHSGPGKVQRRTIFSQETFVFCFCRI